MLSMTFFSFSLVSNEFVVMCRSHLLAFLNYDMNSIVKSKPKPFVILNYF